MRGKDLMDAIASALGERPMTTVQWVADNVLIVNDDDDHHHVITINDYIGIRHPASVRCLFPGPHNHEALCVRSPENRAGLARESADLLGRLIAEA